jgi:hypothetical protein
MVTHAAEQTNEDMIDEGKKEKDRHHMAGRRGMAAVPFGGQARPLGVISDRDRNEGTRIRNSVFVMRGRRTLCPACPFTTFSPHVYDYQLL